MSSVKQTNIKVKRDLYLTQNWGVAQHHRVEPIIWIQFVPVTVLLPDLHEMVLKDMSFYQ